MMEDKNKQYPILKYGLVSDNSEPGYVKVTFNDDDDFVTDFMPVLVRKSKTDKESWPLEINEHVVCLMLHDCDEGIVLGAIPSDEDAPDSGEADGKFRKKFSDGTVIEYDKVAHSLTVDVKGRAKVKTSGSVLVDAGSSLDAKAAIKAVISAPEVEVSATVKATISAPLITLEGAVTVMGALTAASIATSGGGAITAGGNMSVTGEVSAAKVSAGGIDLALHKHSGVQTGPGISGPAVP